MFMRLVYLSIFLVVESSVINIWTKNRFRNGYKLQSFWKNTGLCPASEPNSRGNFLLSDDETLNIEYIGALPNEAIRSIRIHWLLDLITVKNPGSDTPEFNFEQLDVLISRLNRSGLIPNFEIMGNPSGYFHDFNAQSIHWISLLKEVINRYSNLYGASYVQEWKFELMNEPDLKQYNFFNFTLNDYLDYFRACEKAVPSLAGPAGLFRNNRKAHPLCWGFLKYCNLSPCNLSMITFHRKGGAVGSQVVEKGLKLINSIISDYPNLKGIPFGNDEADILTGWQKPVEWRADVRYAALIVQVIIGHIEEMIVKRNIPFSMLSNDNAFLSFSPNYFSQRTLLARFQMNNTKPPHLQFFRKPVYSVMALLSLLGNDLRASHYQPGKEGFSYVMTSHKFQDTYLGVYTNDKANDMDAVKETSFKDVNIRITLGNFSRSGISVGYIMDNLISNPNRIWRNNGSPDFPDGKLRTEMRKAEGFRRIFFRKVKSHQSHIKFLIENINIPSVILINTCYEGTDKPRPVTDLRCKKINENETLLIWSDALVNSKCLLTYDVELKKPGRRTFSKINVEDSIFLTYHLDGQEIYGITGEYRVAAVDYWNRTGPYSNILTLS